MERELLRMMFSGAMGGRGMYDPYYDRYGPPRRSEEDEERNRQARIALYKEFEPEPKNPIPEGFEEKSPLEGTGYPSELIILKNARSRKIYHCTRPECKQILKTPWQAPCGHRFCKDCMEIVGKLPDEERLCLGCVEEIQADDSISVSKYNFDKKDGVPYGLDGSNGYHWENLVMEMDEFTFDPAAEREINRVQILCPWSTKCEYGKKNSQDPKAPKLKIKDFDRHMRDCEYRVVKCTKCKRLIPYKESKDHQQQDCINSDIECPFLCGIENLLAKDLEHHKRECVNKPVLCNLCDTVVQTGGLNRHLLKDCESKCPFPGCEDMPAVRIAEHVCKLHPNMQMLLFNSLVSLPASAEQVVGSKSMDVDEEADAQRGPSVTDYGKLAAQVSKLEARNSEVKETIKASFENSGLDFNSTMEDMKRRAENRKNIEKLEQKIRDAEDDNSKISELEAEYQKLQKKMEEGDRNISKRMELLKNRHQKLCERTDAVEGKLKTMLKIRRGGNLVWRLDNIRQKIDDAKKNKELSTVTSDVFMTDDYRFAAVVNLNGDKKSDGDTYISLDIQLLPGEKDRVLQWPLPFDIWVSMWNCSTPERSIVKRLERSMIAEKLKKPSTDSKTRSISWSKIASLNEILNPDNGFIEDDTVTMEVRITPQSND